ncbi:MAG: phosphoribosylanthranilate isomerase [Thermodesulfobacteriota bacterium]
MVRVKICGITTIEDAMAAVGAGADALGFVFAPSPRRVSPDRARAIVRELPPFVITVGVFVNAGLEEIRAIRAFCKLGLVQLHGSESEDFVNQLGSGTIKALRVGSDTVVRPESYAGATLLLDTYSPSAAGGTGTTFDWSLAAEVARSRPVILAGGLTPENVADAIRTVSPYGVDVSSGVEIEPGRKDHEKISRFVRRAKSANGCA